MVYLFGITLFVTLFQVLYTKEKQSSKIVEIFLGYLFLINVGISSLLGAYAHVFMGPEIAELIGWNPGSPFQFEIGMANLSYGVLGVLSFWIRGRFWDATAIGFSIFLLGCFVGHVHDYLVHHNTAPLNIGPYIWFYDLVFPFLLLSTLAFYKYKKNQSQEKN